MPLLQHRRMKSGGVRLVPALLVLAHLGACSGPRVAFHYPGEEISFAAQQITTPLVYLDIVRDLRPPAQRDGQGRIFGITYPADSRWEAPVAQVYTDALKQDITQTDLLDLVPLQRQADYSLAADILSLHCRLKRQPASLLLPLAVGMGVGMVVGEDNADRVKTGAALGVIGLLAIPLPTSHRAEAEVRLTLRDVTGDIVWERSCLGEVSGKVNLTMTARDDQKLVDRYLSQAVKRANACLLGQLRQALLYDLN